MQRNALLLFAVGCLVALAGCSGALTGGDATTADPTLEDVSYPDGISENGTNVSALADAHADALNGSNFTLTIDTTRNGSAGNRSVHATAAVGSDRDDVRMNVSTGDQRIATYLSAEKRYTRTVVNGNATYRASNRTSESTKLVASSFSGGTYIDQFAGRAGANFTPTGVREVNGTNLVVLRADGSNVSVSGMEIAEYNATIFVDERGVVHRFRVSVRGARGDASVRISLSMRVAGIGETTVAEPPWLDEARNRTRN